MTRPLPETIRIMPEEMQSQFYKALTQIGFKGEKAAIHAQVFMENSLDGVYTHGVNRFSRFIEYVKQGLVDPDGEPSLVHGYGGLEQWNGNRGPGPLNALICTDRATKLASEKGIGCVALSHTNHWMRGGSYGWRAAKAGFVLIAWTNTIANMPPWGASISKLGNNPLVFSVPYKKEAIVLDMAMSQYSFGALELQTLKKQKLPVPGGYNAKGELTDDADAILESRRVLPIGYWKGAGLSLLLDILAAILSGGLSVKAISAQSHESNLSQVFIAIDLSKLGNFKVIPSLVQEIINDYRASASDGRQIVYPGERVLKTRKENSDNGIPVFRSVWDEIKSLA